MIAAPFFGLRPRREPAAVARPLTRPDWRLAAVVLSGLWTSPLRAEAPSYFMPPHRNVPPRVPGGRPTVNSMKGAEILAPARGFSFTQKREAFPVRPEWAPLDLSHLSKVGPFDVERAAQSPLMEEKGVTTTFSYPLKSLPGVDLTASFFGGHRDTIQGAAGGSAAITGGIRIHW